VQLELYHHLLPARLRQKLLAQSTHPVSVVVAFDSAAALNQAKQFCSRLFDPLNPAADLRCSWCRFDQLADERFGREAVEVAATADLIVVASACASEPPPVVQAWLEQALATRTKHDAILSALIGGPTGGLPSCSSLYTYLQRAAARHGLAFFAAEFAAPQTTSALTDLNKRASALTPCLQAILNRPFGIPRWGINE
jgi:hypothetical protein